MKKANAVLGGCFGFFLLCALVILGAWLAVGVAQLLFGFLSDRRQARKEN